MKSTIINQSVEKPLFIKGDLVVCGGGSNYIVIVSVADSEVFSGTVIYIPEKDKSNNEILLGDFYEDFAVSEFELWQGTLQITN